MRLRTDPEIGTKVRPLQYAAGRDAERLPDDDNTLTVQGFENVKVGENSDGSPRFQSLL